VVVLGRDEDRGAIVNRLAPQRAALDRHRRVERKGRRRWRR
jgi:hypothetical protein